MATPGRVEDEAFVTLTTNDPYGYGAVVLGQSLRDVGTTRQLVVMVTKEVSQPMRRQLSLVYDVIQQVDPFDSQDTAHLAMLTRPELGITFTKVHCWTLKQYKKCVFIDADCLVLQNVDDLFDREEFSAAPDVGWPDIFNSGVFVFRPSEETYRGILQCAVTQGSFDGGDQGLLNTYFSHWSTQDIKYHLPFIFNMTSAVSYTYRPALERFGQDIKIVHFIGTAKPWLYTYYPDNHWLSTPEGCSGAHDMKYVKKWWDVFLGKIRPSIEQEQGIDMSGKLGKLCLEASPTGGPSAEGVAPDVSHQEDWEKGQIDYLGKDSFDNIAKHMAEVVNRNETSGARPKGIDDIWNHLNTCGSATVSVAGLPSNNVSQQPQHLDFISIDYIANLIASKRETSQDEPQSDAKTDKVSHQEDWEKGQIDYLGKDSFDNIAKHMDDVQSGKVKIEGEKDVELQATTQEDWEKGQMDYLGKDSFENIAKHIAEIARTSDIPEERPKDSDVPVKDKEIELLPLKNLGTVFAVDDNIIVDEVGKKEKMATAPKEVEEGIILPAEFLSIVAVYQQELEKGQIDDYFGKDIYEDIVAKHISKSSDGSEVFGDKEKMFEFLIKSGKLRVQVDPLSISALLSEDSATDSEDLDQDKEAEGVGGNIVAEGDKPQVIDLSIKSGNLCVEVNPLTTPDESTAEDLPLGGSIPKRKARRPVDHSGENGLDDNIISDEMESGVGETSREKPKIVDLLIKSGKLCVETSGLLEDSATEEEREEPAIDEEEVDLSHLEDWEKGQMNYMGEDSFENIARHMAEVAGISCKTWEKPQGEDDLSAELGMFHLQPSRVLARPISADDLPMEASRQEDWELGQIDYMGKDSFDNIAKHITEMASKGEMY